MSLKRRMMITTEGFELSEGNITNVQDSYNYLGSLQDNGNHEKAAMKSALAKYLRRVRQVLRIQLNSQNKIRAIHTYALPIIRYPSGMIAGQMRTYKPQISRRGSSSPSIEGFTLSPEPKGCRLNRKREAKDLCLSEPLSKMKKQRSSIHQEDGPYWWPAK